MSPAEFSALLVLTTVSSFSPGPNTTLSTALAANFGLRRALRFVLAVPVGWGLLFSLCAGGVGALVVAVPPLRLAIQVFGVGYLLWLAYKLMGVRFQIRLQPQAGWRERFTFERNWNLTPINSQLAQAGAASMKVTFRQGVLLQFLNIKAWMLALTVVAGWLAGRSDAGARFALVLPLMLAFGLVSNLAYALAGSLLRDWLAQGRRLLAFNRAMAAVLVLTATWMATA